VQSETARTILRALIKEPLTASELADMLDMSVENVSYHLGNIEDRNLIEAYDIVYSEKGREMTVYGISRDPLMLVFWLLKQRRAVTDGTLPVVFSHRPSGDSHCLQAGVLRLA
jgi:DNA-binding transcriptional ArsR family regulator